jgi:hypothetical protein
VGPDLALALLINRTASAYAANPPAYISYRETTLVQAPSLGRSQEIDRDVVVRNADDEAVMHDVPGGAQHIGQAFPVVPYFDPFSNYGFSYFANLKRIDISLTRGVPWTLPPPAPNPEVDVVVPYMPFWDVRYAADSRPGRLHVYLQPTSLWTGSMFPSEVVEDPHTHLPSKIVLQDTKSDMVIALHYATIDGHWIITHGTFTATEHALFLTFVVTADVTYSNYAFSASPPPEAALLPPPSPTPSPTP